jgi:YegS/Rv2252/BmrU family lipid kinase
MAVEVTGAPGEAVVLARDAAARGVSRILIAGGDGTTGEVVTGLMEGTRGAAQRPGLGLLPVGSGCDLARTLGLPRRIETALEIIAAGNLRTLDVGRVELQDGRGQMRVRYFANEVSAGLSGDTVTRVGPLAARIGPRLGFVAGALASVATHSPFHATLEIDGERIHDGAISLVVVANGSYFGAGMRVAPDASIDDGLLEVVLARGLSRREILTHLPAFYLGRHGSHPSVSFHAARHVELIETTREAAVEVDGEGGFSLPLRAECLPAALRVFAPEVTTPIRRSRAVPIAPLVPRPIALQRARG